MKISVKEKEYDNADDLKEKFLCALCEYAVLLGKNVIPISSGKDRFYYHRYSSGINYCLVQWMFQFLNAFEDEGKIEILDEFGNNIKISDDILTNYKKDRNL